MIIKPSNRIGGVKTYYFATKLAEIAALNREGKDILNLGIGSPDLNPPAEVIETLREASLEPNANRYQPYRGIPELRQAFAFHYDKMLNVVIDPDREVLPLMGSKEAVMHISMAFLNKGDKVLVPNPGYPSYRATAELAGATSLSYDLTEENGWMPDITSIEKNDLDRVKIMWINYPNMPTGATISEERLHKLVDFARRHDILLCHDNPYNFILNQQPRSIFSIDGAKDCCLELYSLSKCFNMAGWRVGGLIGNARILDIVLRFKSNMDSGMYRPVQLAASRALHLDEEWFNSLNVIYRDRLKVVHELFDLLDCTYENDSSGLFVWAKAPGYIKDVPAWIDDILHQAQVFITPGFIFGSNGEDYVRIALCSTVEQFKKARRRIESRLVKSIA